MQSREIAYNKRLQCDSAKAPEASVITSKN
jgi:hypothetical protein